MWLFGLVNFVLLAAGFGLTFFVPDLVQDRTGYTDFEVGVLAAIPFGFATVAMIVASRAAARGLAVPMRHRRGRHALTAYAQSPLLLTVGITLAAVGLLVRAAALLGAPDGAPQRQRRRGRDRARRGARQPRRLRRARRSPGSPRTRAAGTSCR